MHRYSTDPFLGGRGQHFLKKIVLLQGKSAPRIRSTLMIQPAYRLHMRLWPGCGLVSEEWCVGFVCEALSLAVLMGPVVAHASRAGLKAGVTASASALRAHVAAAATSSTNGKGVLLMHHAALLAIGAPVRAQSGREQALVNGRSHRSHYSAARPRT